MKQPMDARGTIVDLADPSGEWATHATRHVGLLLFDGCSLLGAGIIAEAFRLANEFELARAGCPAYRLSLISHRGGNVACSSSIRVWTQGLDTSPLQNFCAVFIARSESEPVAERDGRLLSWLSTGSTTLLDHHPADHGSARTITHRLDDADHPDPMAARQPGAPTVFWFRGSPIAAYEVGAAPADMALAQIAHDLGDGAAEQVATGLTQHKAAGAQTDEPFSNEVPAPPCDRISDKIRDSARWISENYVRPISVADAARVASMSERNYLRRFRSELGVTPSAYLLDARLDMTRRLLLETDLPVDKIARRCGLGNGDRLARVFRKRFGASPTEFRGDGRAQSRRRDLTAMSAPGQTY